MMYAIVLVVLLIAVLSLVFGQYDLGAAYRRSTGKHQRAQPALCRFQRSFIWLFPVHDLF